MLESIFHKRWTSGRHRRGPFGPYIDAIAASLVDRGYAVGTVRKYAWAAKDFGQWLMRHGFAASDVDEQVVASFLDERCSQRGKSKTLSAAVHGLLFYLRAAGVVPTLNLIGRMTPVDELVGRYEQYLRVERGLAAVTIAGHRPFVRGFLVELCGDGPAHLRGVTSGDVARFLVHRAESLTHVRARKMTTALRSLLRFLFREGETGVDLTASVLSVADRARSTFVKYLASDDVTRLLDACDRESPTGMRDYAILLLLARLGLRGGEVVALELDDIDWRAGEITVPGKGGYRDRLPLPVDVGEALAAYVRHARPKNRTRRVFLRIKAPCRGLSSPSTVSTIVCGRLERAGLHPPWRGAHILRHSLATEMLRQGASIAEIGQVLRHRSSQATEVYAKVDFERLRLLALPWPGKGENR